MTLTEFAELLNEYKGDSTPQTWSRFDFAYENEYIKIISVDCSNKPGGKVIVTGKQWGIIFEYGENDFRQLERWRNLVAQFNDISITPRKGYKGQFGIRFYNMSAPPDEEIINAFIAYLFG